VFGLEQGERHEEVRELLTELLTFGESPVSLVPIAQRPFFGRGRFARFEQVREEVDRRLFELIAERRASSERGEDVLGMLLDARHEDGSPMSAQELRDELMTALVAGHETTASALAWAFEELAREPTVTQRLIDELDAGSDDTYLTATVHEVLRRRPVLPNAEPRLVKRAIEIGGIEYPPGVVLFANAYLVHHDPDIYPQPYAFRPERFLREPPGTYTWIPFGGGRRRCLGASFALVEMRVVLRAVLGSCTIEPIKWARERVRRRGIALRPSRRATVLLRDRPSIAPVAVVGDPAEARAHDLDGVRVGVDQYVAPV
jgi:cytochrome P450